MLPYGALGCYGLYCPTVFAHSDIKSFIEGAIGHCSAGCTGDWKLVQGLDCAGFSVAACTSWSCLPSSSSTFLAKVQILAFISKSSNRAYIPPLGLTEGLNLSISLGFGSSQPLEVSAT